MGLGVLVDPGAHQHGRHQIGPVRLVELVALGVGIGAVFDGIDAELDGVIDRLISVGVGGDLHAQGMGCVDHGLDLVIGHELQLRVIADRHDAARRHDLDQVGALATQATDRAARRLRAVDQIVGPAGVGKFGIQAVQGVAVAAGRAERRARHPHARSGRQACVDGVLECDDNAGRAADIANRGEARQQGRAGVVDRIDLVIEVGAGHGGVDRITPMIALGDVDMVVDQAGQDGSAGKVNDLRAFGARGETFLNRNDSLVVDDDRDLFAGGLARAVDQPACMNDQIPRERRSRRPEERDACRSRHQSRSQIHPHPSDSGG